MTSIEGAKRNSVSIYDYPEHLNPFREDDNHNKLRTWSFGRKKGGRRFSFASLKDFRNTLNFRSFRKKERTNSIGISSLSCISAKNSPESDRKYSYNASTNNTPVMYRNSSISQTNPRNATPLLPRSRFHERVSHLNNTSESANLNNNERMSLQSPTHRGALPYALPGLTNSQGDRGSYTSLQSNPFDETSDASLRLSTRKKRKAPMPPQITNMPSIPSIIVTEEKQVNNELEISNTVRKQTLKEESFKDEIDIDDPSFKTELRIIEDDDVKTNNNDLIQNTLHENEIKSDMLENKDDPEIINNKIDKVVVIPVENTQILIATVKNDENRINDSLNNEKIVNGSAETKTDQVPEANDKDLFKRIDYISYKRQQSLEIVEPLGSKEQKENEPSKILTSKTNTEIHSPKTAEAPKLKYKISFETKPNMSDFDMPEFQEFDEIIKSIEKNAIDPKIQTNKQDTVSDMKLKFEKPKKIDIDFKNSSPNPIPKPRRSRVFNSTSSDSSKSSSIPTTPVTDENSTIKI